MCRITYMVSPSLPVSQWHRLGASLAIVALLLSSVLMVNHAPDHHEMHGDESCQICLQLDASGSALVTQALSVALAVASLDLSARGVFLDIHQAAGPYSARASP